MLIRAAFAEASGKNGDGREFTLDEQQFRKPRPHHSLAKLIRFKTCITADSLPVVGKVKEL
jgi:hypothetical protein